MYLTTLCSAIRVLEKKEGTCLANPKEKGFRV